MISDAMRAAVGRELSRAVSYPVSASDIRRWAVAVYFPEEPPPRYWDAEVAARSRWGGIVAPEDFNPFAWMAAEPRGIPGRRGGSDADFTERCLGIAGPGLAQQLNGGCQVEYGAPIRVDDVITSVQRLARYSERDGRLGRMLLTDLESTWTNQRDEFVRRTTLTLIRY